MTNAEAYNNAPLGASIDAWMSFRNNIIMGHRPTFEEWLEYECDRMPTLRNCDRFKTEGDAHREYLRIFDHPDPVHYAKWLFASTEGGAK